MENLIQQLKDNEKPFGLMSEEMQEKAKEMPWKHFQVWGYVGSEDKWIMPGSDTFRSHFTYRLRPDYEDDLEIVECEIITDQGKMWYMQGCLRHKLHRAINDPDFVGFKFKDGTVAAAPFRPMLIPTSPRGSSIPFDETKANEDYMHATHVLFRRKKQVEDHE